MEGAPGGGPARRFTVAHLVLTLPWIALVIDAWAPIRDNSFLWHVRAGSLQLELGRVLTEDPFSFTMAGTPWRTQSWLAELVYALGERATGLGFVPLMMLTLTMITFLGFGLVVYRWSRSVPATALLLLLSTVLLLSFLVPRPVLFSFVLFPLVILAWDRPATRWSVPLLFWIWASVHGSFVIGLAYVGLALLAERRWRLLPTAIVAGLATLVTAHGLGVLQMLVDFLAARDTLALLSEWRRPELLSVVFLPFVFGIGLLILGSWRRIIEPRHLIVIVPFLLLALSSTRAVPVAWIALLPLVASSLAGLGDGWAGRFSPRAAAIFSAAVIVLPFLVAGDGALDAKRFPLEARNALVGERLFHDDRTGGYLIWADWPERQVVIDDRAELYGERMREFVAVRRGEADWRPLFTREGVDEALLSVGEPLIDDLVTAGWREVYRDEAFVVIRP
jgi:hypothetical protein